MKTDDGQDPIEENGPIDWTIWTERFLSTPSQPTEEELGNRKRGNSMTDWSKCPAVESVPGKVSGNLGVHRHQAARLRTL